MTEAHRLGQVRIGQATIRQMVALWPLLDLGDVDGSFDRWLRAALPVVARSHQASSGLAANYYRAYRTAETGLLTPLQPTMAGAVTQPQLATSLTVTGPVAYRTALGAGHTPERAAQIAQAGSARAMMRQALQGGRETILATVNGDRRAVGWARATSGDPCHFCAMLASRGPVYRQESGEFQAHDGCSCTVEPAYRDDPASWPAGATEYQALWDEVAQGLPPDEARNAFRRALEAA